MGFTNLDQMKAEVAKQIADLEQQAIDKIKNAARVSLGEFMSRTPVWSGKTVENYQWGIGGAPGGMLEPSSNEPVGATGSMPLGEEPRRADAEGVATASLESVLAGYNSLDANLVMTNNSDIWDLVDNGEAPTAQRARNQGGVSVLAEQSAKAILGGDFS